MDRGTGKGREEEKIWEVERKDGEDLTQNKVFHQSRMKSGSRRKEEGEEGLEVLQVESLWIGMRMGDERGVSKEETNLTRLRRGCMLLNYGVENEDERECACLGLKRGRREGHKRKQKQSRNQVAWAWRSRLAVQDRDKSTQRRIYSGSPP
jgi:hypothetical protein